MIEPSPTTDPSDPPATPPKPATRARVADPKRVTPRRTAGPLIVPRPGVDLTEAVATANRISQMRRRALYSVLATLVFGGGFLLYDYFASRTLDTYRVGACIDADAGYEGADFPNLVDCADSSAKARILKFYYSSGSAVLCPRGTDFAIELKRANSTRVLCLAYQ